MCDVTIGVGKFNSRSKREAEIINALLFVLDGNDSTLKKSDSNIVKTSGNNLNLPLKSEHLASKFKTFANAKFISLTKGPDNKMSEER